MTSTAPSPADAPTKRRVLLVEDEPTIAITLGDALDDCGYDVTLLADGGDALPCIDHDRFDAVISDLRLPGATGLEVLHRARLRSPATRLLLITAYAPEQQHAALRALHAGLLAKPFANEDVIAWLGRDNTEEPRRGKAAGEDVSKP